MKTCPRCGYANPDTAALCEDCHKALSAPDSAVAPPSGMSGQPQEPVPMPRPSFWTPLRLYLLGIGLGLIPLAVWLVGWSASSCSYIYGGLYWPTSELGGASRRRRCCSTSSSLWAAAVCWQWMPPLAPPARI